LDSSRDGRCNRRLDLPHPARRQLGGFCWRRVGDSGATAASAVPAPSVHSWRRPLLRSYGQVLRNVLGTRAHFRRQGDRGGSSFVTTVISPARHDDLPSTGITRRPVGPALRSAGRHLGL